MSAVGKKLVERMRYSRCLAELRSRILRFLKNSGWIFQLIAISISENGAVSFATEQVSHRQTDERAAMAAVLENWNRIVFWNGTATVDDWESDSEGKDRHTRNTIEFFFDRHARQLRWRSNLAHPSDGDSPSSKGSVTRIDRMVKHCGIYKPLGQGIQIDELRAPRDFFAMREFDLVSVLTGGIDDMAGALCRVGGKFQLPADWLSNPTRLERDDRLTVRHQDADVSIAIDSSNPDTLSELERRTAKGTENWRFKYQRVDSVWLPSEVEINLDRTPDSRKNRRVIRFQQSIVNRNIDPSEFELIKLGVRSGDLIRDTRSNVQYVFDRSNELKLDSGTNNPTRGTDDPWPRYVALSVAGWATALGIYAAWVWRKPRNQRPVPSVADKRD